MKRFFITLIILILPSSYAIAGEGAEFLNIVQDAAPRAMGEAFVSNSDYLYAFEFNPASVVALEKSQLAFSHMTYYSEVSYDHLVFSYNASKKTAYACTLKMLGIDDVERDDTGAYLGSFTNSSYELKLGIAYLMKKRLALGLSLNYIREKIYYKTASAFAVDLGLLLKKITLNKNNKFSAGISLKNRGTKIKWNNTRYPLPQKVIFGFSIKNSSILTKFLKQCTFSFDYVNNKQQDDTMNYGIELSATKNFFFRIGLINSSNKSTPSLLTAGCGFGYRFGEFSYSTRKHVSLGTTHTFSFTVNYR